MNMPPDEVMRMLAQEALRQAFEDVSKHLREFAQHPVVEGLSAKEALVAAADALLNTNNTVFGEKH